MNDLWQACAQVSEVLRPGRDISLLRALLSVGRRKRWEVYKVIEGAFAGYSYLEEQPFLLGYRLSHHHPEESRALRASRGGSNCLEGLRRVSAIGFRVAGHLRASIPGFPDLLVPHVELTAPLASTEGLNPTFPWIAAPRESLRVGEDDRSLRDNFDGDLVELSGRLNLVARCLKQERPFRSIGAIRASLSGAQVLELRGICERYREATNSYRLDREIGPEVLRRRAARFKLLRDTVSNAPAFAQDLFRAFEEAERLIENSVLLVAELSIDVKEEPLAGFRFASWERDRREIRLSCPVRLPSLRLGSLISVELPEFRADGLAFLRSKAFSLEEEVFRLELLEDSAELRRVLCEEAS